MEYLIESFRCMENQVLHGGARDGLVSLANSLRDLLVQ